MKDIIIFGTGKYFESKKETLKRKYHITAFLDNKIGIKEHTGYQDTEIPMMNPEAVNQGDTTEIFLMSIFCQYVEAALQYWRGSAPPCISIYGGALF